MAYEKRLNQNGDLEILTDNGVFTFPKADPRVAAEIAKLTPNPSVDTANMEQAIAETGDQKTATRIRSDPSVGLEINEPPINPQLLKPPQPKEPTMFDLFKQWLNSPQRIDTSKLQAAIQDSPDERTAKAPVDSYGTGVQRDNTVMTDAGGNPIASVQPQTPNQSVQPPRPVEVDESQSWRLPQTEEERRKVESEEARRMAKEEWDKGKAYRERTAQEAANPSIIQKIGSMLGLTQNTANAQEKPKFSVDEKGELVKTQPDGSKETVGTDPTKPQPSNRTFGPLANDPRNGPANLNPDPNAPDARFNKKDAPKYDAPKPATSDGIGLKPQQPSTPTTGSGVSIDSALQGLRGGSTPGRWIPRQENISYSAYDPNAVKGYMDAAEQAQKASEETSKQEAEVKQKALERQAKALDELAKADDATRVYFMNKYDQMDKILDEHKQRVLVLYNSEIDPNRIFKGLDGKVKKVGTQIASTLWDVGDVIAGRRPGGENPITKSLNDEIDRDVDAQKATMNAKASALSAEQNYINGLARVLNDRQQAISVYRAQWINTTDKILENISEREKNPIVLAKIAEARSEFEKQKAKMLMDLTKEDHTLVKAFIPPQTYSASDALKARNAHLKAVKENLELQKGINDLVNPQATGDVIKESSANLVNVGGQSYHIPNQTQANNVAKASVLAQELVGKLSQLKAVTEGWTDRNNPLGANSGRADALIADIIGIKGQIIALGVLSPSDIARLEKSLGNPKSILPDMVNGSRLGAIDQAIKDASETPSLMLKYSGAQIATQVTTPNGDRAYKIGTPQSNTKTPIEGSKKAGSDAKVEKP